MDPPRWAAVERWALPEAAPLRVALCAAVALLLAGCSVHEAGGLRQQPRPDAAQPGATGVRSPSDALAQTDLGDRPAAAEQHALTIFLGSQTFAYHEDGRLIASGPVSTGTTQHPTPTGEFRVLSKDADKRSGSYTNYFDQPTPMPYALQFHGPYFVHEGWLPGYADSHGCVRLHHDDARLVFERMRLGDPILVTETAQAGRVTGYRAPFPLF